jgi:hypothetical protein
MTIKYWTGLTLGAALALTPALAVAGSRASAAIPAANASHVNSSPSYPPRGLLNGYGHADEHGREGIRRGAFGHHFKSRGSC